MPGFVGWTAAKLKISKEKAFSLAATGLGKSRRERFLCVWQVWQPVADLKVVPLARCCHGCRAQHQTREQSVNLSVSVIPMGTWWLNNISCGAC